MRYVNLVIGIVAKCFPFSIEKPTKTQHQHDIQHVRKLTKKVTYLKGLNASWVTKKNTCYWTKNTDYFMLPTYS